MSRPSTPENAGTSGSVPSTPENAGTCNSKCPGAPRVRRYRTAEASGASAQQSLAPTMCSRATTPVNA